MTSHTCVKCHKEKDESEYYPSRRAKGDYRCKECCRAMNRKYYHTPKGQATAARSCEKRNQRRAEQRIEPEKKSIRVARYRQVFESLEVPAGLTPVLPVEQKNKKVTA